MNDTTLPPAMPPTPSTPEVPSTVRNPWGRLLMLASVLAVALLAAGLCVAWLVPRHSGPAYALFSLEQLTVGQPQYFRPFNMGRDPEGRSLGIWLVRLPSDAVLALFSRDTHRGSQTDQSTYQGRPTLRGISTGSHYLLDGTRIFGPAPRSLDRFETRLDGPFVRIDTTHLVLGECANPTVPTSTCSTPGAEPLTEQVNFPGN